MKFLTLAAVLTLTALPAIAQTNCGHREAVILLLESAFGESRIAVGLEENGFLMEIFSSDGGETWKIIFTDTNGWSCIVAAGDSYEYLGEAFLNMDEPA